MARVRRRAASAHAARAPNGIAKLKSRKHKVIMESIIQEKKKLWTVISFEARAPPGYTFIPAGNPLFTNACKEMCRKNNLKVFAVTTTPHQRMNLSQQVHRIGYHFPSWIVATVCMELGFHLTSNGKVIQIEPLRVNRLSRRQRAAQRAQRANSEISQTTINAEARDVLRDLFPNIPDEDLNQIINTSFQKGQRKVGTAEKLPLARRAQLAVVAHVRHVYTNYDQLLKIFSFHEARSLVEDDTLEKVIQWRGDDENGKTVLEDVFREVIVISDDEDDNGESDIYDSSPANRDASVQIVSLDTEVQTRPVNYSDPSRNAFLEISDDEAPSGFRFLQEIPPQNKIDASKVDRRGFSRYEAWDRARNRYRDRNRTRERNQRNRIQYRNRTRNRVSTFHQTDAAGSAIDGTAPYLLQQKLSDPVNKQQPEPPNDHHAVATPQARSAAFNTIGPRRMGSPDTINSQRQTLVRREVSPFGLRVPPQRPPDYLRLSNGAVYERIPAHIREEVLPESIDPVNTPVFVSGPNIHNLDYERNTQYSHPSPTLPTSYHRIERSLQERTVLPSIEIPQSAPPSIQHLDDYRTDHLSRLTTNFPGHPSLRPIEDLSWRVNVIDITNRGEEFSKKRRLESQELPYDSFRPHLSPRAEREPISHNRSDAQYFPSVSRNFKQGPSREEIHPSRKNIISLEPEGIPIGRFPPSFVPLRRPQHGIDPYPESSRQLPEFAPVSGQETYIVRDDVHQTQPNHLPPPKNLHLHHVNHDRGPIYLHESRPSRETELECPERRSSKFGLHEAQRKPVYSDGFVQPIYIPRREPRPLPKSHHSSSQTRDLEDSAFPRRSRIITTVVSEDQAATSVRDDVGLYQSSNAYQVPEFSSYYL